MKSDLWLNNLEGRLSQQFRFLLEVDQLKNVIRGSRIGDNSRKENTAEHSWHVALFAVIFAEWSVADVGIDRVIKMLLIHDLVEIDAGDTPLFEQSDDSFIRREQAAAERLFGLLPDDQGAEYRHLWEEFEAGKTPDARFAKAIDRLQPIVLNHVVGGGTWLDYDVDEGQERLLTNKIERGSPTLWGAAEAIFADAVSGGWLKPTEAT